MGCRQSQSIFDKRSLENEKVDKFEESLGFRGNQSVFYEGIISRLSNTSQTAELILDSFVKFSKLSLSDEAKEAIMQAFANDNSMDLKGFRCFCIISSNSSELEKGESLWYTYDTNLKDFLDSSDIKAMLSAVVKSSVSIDLELAIKAKCYDEKKLTDWLTYLKERVESLEIRLNKHFTQGKESVSKEEFILRLQDRPEGYITSSSALRTLLEHTQVIPTRFANPYKNMKVTKLTG